MPSAFGTSYAFPPIWGRLSISSTFCPIWEASRSAMTLPAKPAPTTSQSNMHGPGRDMNALLMGRTALDEIFHTRPGQIPGVVEQMVVDLAHPRLSRHVQQALAALHEARCVLC